MVCSMSILQLNVPDKLRGRVMGIHTITFSLLSVGALILGLLAELYERYTYLNTDTWKGGTRQSGSKKTAHILN